MRIYLCARVNNFYSRQHADTIRAIEMMFLLVVIPKQINSCFFSFPFTNTMYIPQYKLLLGLFLVVNPKRELAFKVAVTAGLQDINSTYIRQKNPFCLHLCVYYYELR